MNKFYFSKYLLFAILIFVVEEGITQVKSVLLPGDNCIACHQEEDYLPEDFQTYDVHLQQGLSCSGCHGGDPSLSNEEKSMDPNKGFIGIPERKAIPYLCGKCHSKIEIMRDYQPRIATDQVSQYFQSYHGKALNKGDSKVANCTSCHSIHSILPAKDPRSSIYPKNVPVTCNNCHGDNEYMAEYGIPTDQHQKFETSVHGIALFEKGDLSAPACNDCHGNHGAMPPGIASISHVCGTCHVNNMEFFLKSPMALAYETKGLHACEECHGNHSVEKTSDEMIGDGENSVCIKCHKLNDKGYEVAVKIKMQLMNAVSSYDSAVTQWTEVRKVGMDDEEIAYLIQEAHQSIVQTRTLVHTFDPAITAVQTNEARLKASSAYSLGTEQLREFDVRRYGLGGATFFITLLALAIYFKIRNIEKEE